MIRASIVAINNVTQQAGAMDHVGLVTLELCNRISGIREWQLAQHAKVV